MLIQLNNRFFPKHGLFSGGGWNSSVQSAVNSDLVLSQLTPTSLNLVGKLKGIPDTESLIYQGQKLSRKFKFKKERNCIMEFWRSFENIRRSFDFPEIQWNPPKFATFSRLTWTLVFLKPWADLEFLFMFVLVAFCVVSSANCIQ